MKKISSKSNKNWPSYSENQVLNFIAKKILQWYIAQKCEYLNEYVTYTNI